MGLRDMIIVKMWESIKPGETVLFERTGEGDMGMGVYHTLLWAQSEEFKIIVIDILDSYSTLVSKAKLMGLDVSLLNNADVIKIGGVKKQGHVIAHIEGISEPTIMLRKFREAYEPVIGNSDRKVLAVVIGLEKLFVVSEFSHRGIQVIIDQLAGYIGNTSRLGIYLLKKDILPVDKRFVIKLLEDIATTVVRTQKKGRLTEFHIVKSLNSELEGVLIRV
ncbi:DUF257 family protein [Thermococcus sp.]|uniref:DUF257 family protein n=1 Tax=Thermococcus sp. TaxID=35749 RepID=UPI0026095946|nr:DUF257 family protein [Thermococcus sp.]